jgi:hypothetical protein
MFIPVGISLLVIVITIIIHGYGSAFWIGYQIRHFELSKHKWSLRHSMRVLTSSAVFLIFLHFIEIIIWAVLYLSLPGQNVLKTFEEAAYFSLITYTTLGYGDITLGANWRVLSGFEAINGTLLIGWSTAMFYSVVKNVTQKYRSNKSQNLKK